MPRRNRSERRRAPSSEQPVDRAPTYQQMALQLVRSGICSPSILGPITPRLAAQMAASTTEGSDA